MTNVSDAAKIMQKKGLEKHGVEFFRKEAKDAQTRMKEKMGPEAYRERMRRVRRKLSVLGRSPNPAELSTDKN